MERCKNTMMIQVIVKPGAKRSAVEETSEGLIVRLHEKAHDNEANEGLIKILSEYYDVSKGQVIIQKGMKSRHKLVEIVK